MRFDFRSRCGVSWDDVGGSVRYGEAIDMLQRLRVDTGSHTFASEAGWDWPASQAELALIQLTELFANHLPDGKKFERPISILRPWPSKETVTPEEFDYYERELIRRSAFADDGDD